ncbi:cytochrome b [Thalassotalea ponticola]|uniref:cytochrome b n=1 Tax=Thalassotalea ponticola TaxID=1523392 RepID=UPI0025B2F60F|nr:cytochrome b [Thalassotalea ponticola]MDN3651413.1 cytochrome b [Thalassotalea ponticola]
MQPQQHQSIQSARVDKYRYPRLAKLLHWLSALTVFCLFGVGLWMVELDYYSSWYRTAPHYHKSVGLLLALVIVIRFIYVQCVVKAKPVQTHAKWQQKSAKAAHLLMYALMMVLFMSGYLISTADGRAIDVFNWFSLPSLGEVISQQEDVAGLIHEYTAYALIALVVIHAIAAIKHHVIDKDDTLKRMY